MINDVSPRQIQEGTGAKREGGLLLSSKGSWICCDSYNLSGCSGGKNLFEASDWTVWLPRAFYNCLIQSTAGISAGTIQGVSIATEQRYVTEDESRRAFVLQYQKLHIWGCLQGRLHPFIYIALSCSTLDFSCSQGLWGTWIQSLSPLALYNTRIRT